MAGKADYDGILVMIRNHKKITGGNVSVSILIGYISRARNIKQETAKQYVKDLAEQKRIYFEGRDVIINE
jgi:hypothetical protein